MSKDLKEMKLQTHAGWKRVLGRGNSKSKDLKQKVPNTFKEQQGGPCTWGRENNKEVRRGEGPDCGGTCNRCKDFSFSSE